ncbi:putative SOS response-associated peptidase YedK [Kineothrix alysoides]|uniref:Abasic site processing protein n=1 Tax=Kineothrix alysoides TaxID=1469948 RepID=A0A4R1R2F4_9FIRM|nr:SOS response-associated peptidase family protein [Kineothrix alysoides]TCL59554.1 putative SOS response-associated peptidase YedK [Kineothrix alysoides]
MCGRYYVDDETVHKIEKIVRQVSEKIVHKKGDIYPTNQVPIIHSNQDSLTSSVMTWGFPKHTDKGVIVNARSETVKTKRTFSKSIIERRCIVPAAGFYEWDKEKNKIRFERNDNNIIYMAGIWKSYDGENRFVILTTNANKSVENVHERMPLILEDSELESWVFDNQFTDFILHKTPTQLKQIRDYEQFKLPL